jgi:rRNA biogenesis protein RRP5
LTLFCFLSKLSDNVDADVTLALRGFREGDRVKAIILNIDKRRISLGLKPSYFTEEDLLEVTNNDNLADDHQAPNMLDLVDDASTSGSEHDNDDRSSSEEDENSMDVDIILDETQMEYHPTQASSIPKFAAPPSLPLAGGFHWSGDVPSLNEDEEEGLSSDDSDDAEKPSKKKRKRKEIEQDLTSEMHTKTPESNADFERLLLGSPNSSYLWIQYMSFQLPLSELDKAREIGRKAIQTINFREEKERLNVWMALLNLENVYGTEDSLQAVFKEAARANDSKTVHLRLASILDQAEKQEVSQPIHKNLCSS